jgi:hypothetical protein
MVVQNSSWGCRDAGVSRGTGVWGRGRKDTRTLRTQRPRRERFRIASCVTAIGMSLQSRAWHARGAGQSRSIAVLCSCRRARWMPTRTTRLNASRSKHPGVPWRERGVYTSVRGRHFGKKQDVLVKSIAYRSMKIHLGIASIYVVPHTFLT